jgi:hypothetical protein
MATKFDLQAGAPRRMVSEQRVEPGASNARAEISNEELRALIEEAAYYRAQKRGFAPGRAIEDWIAAEAEVMTRLGLWP